MMGCPRRRHVASFHGERANNILSIGVAEDAPDLVGFRQLGRQRLEMPRFERPQFLHSLKVAPNRRRGIPVGNELVTLFIKLGLGQQEVLQQAILVEYRYGVLGN